MIEITKENLLDKNVTIQYTDINNITVTLQKIVISDFFDSIGDIQIEIREKNRWMRLSFAKNNVKILKVFND